MNTLFALYVGGRAKGCSIELHDVMFLVGTSVEKLYTKILDRWFGRKEKCHIDSWMPIEYVDGYSVTVSDQKPTSQAVQLYFVNLGGYEDECFTELHENIFVVAANDAEAKKRAKAQLLLGKQQVHTDDLYDVDDCIRLDKVDDYHIHLTPSSNQSALKPNNGYHPIPKDVVAEYLARG